ncbi:hypothetical protein pb186bvf_007719 [Paramecium bursaria]
MHIQLNEKKQRSKQTPYKYLFILSNGQDTTVSTQLSSSIQHSYRKSSLYQSHKPLIKNQSISLHIDTDEGIPKSMTCYQQINNKMHIFTKTRKNHSLNNPNFYEGIYLVGSKDDNTEILFKYGSTNLDNLLPELLFPNGPQDLQKSLSDSMSEVNSILYKRHVIENNYDCFVIPIKIQQSFEIKSQIQQNINSLAFCICVRVQDIQHNKKGYTIFERILCLVTFHPVFQYFFEFLIDVINAAKQERLQDITFTQFIQECSLFEALPMNAPSQEISLLYYQYQNIHLRDIKILHNTIYLAQIIMNIILENSIIFIADNIMQLGSVQMYFLSKLNWMHQLVPSIPLSNLEILNMPVPLIGGIVRNENLNQIIDYYTQIVFIDCNSCKAFNCNDFNKSLIYLQLVKKLYGKHFDSIGDSIRQFQFELTRQQTDDYLFQKFKQSQYYSEIKEKSKKM